MTTPQNSSEVLIKVQGTPNPNAWKFILDRTVLTEGKATFNTKEECFGLRLAEDILAVPDVKQVHFFSNVITVTHTFDANPDDVKASVVSVIQTRVPVHDPNFNLQKAKISSRSSLPAEVQRIEELLDNTVRPGLQGDGGDIEVIKYEDGKLYVHYEGACGTCPSATSGTLMAIEGILRDEFNPEIEVIPL